MKIDEIHYWDLETFLPLCFNYLIFWSFASIPGFRCGIEKAICLLTKRVTTNGLWAISEILVSSDFLIWCVELKRGTTKLENSGTKPRRNGRIPKPEVKKIEECKYRVTIYNRKKRGKFWTLARIWMIIWILVGCSFPFFNLNFSQWQAQSFTPTKIF